MPEPVPVRVRDCACPDLPHADEGDIVWLAPKVSFELGLAAQQNLEACGGDGNVLTRLWMLTFIRFGFRGSNCGLTVNDLLEDFELASPVGDVASDLYSEVILRPLRASLSTSSPGGRTGGSTSRTKRSRTPSPA